MISYDLIGKTALVTGGASGIGYATAKMLAGFGATVAVNFLADDPRGPEAVDKLVGRRRQGGHGARQRCRRKRMRKRMVLNGRSPTSGVWICWSTMRALLGPGIASHHRTLDLITEAALDGAAGDQPAGGVSAAPRRRLRR